MADFPSDKAIPLDGMVGSFSDLEETAAPATANDSRIRVFVSGDGVSDPGVMGLDEDLRLLVQAFIQGSRSSDRQTTPATLASDVHGDIEIALHGLNLAPEEEGELHHLIRELVRKRVASKEATK
jgi:hypothetical protein